MYDILRLMTASLVQQQKFREKSFCRNFYQNFITGIVNPAGTNPKPNINVFLLPK